MLFFKKYIPSSFVVAICKIKVHVVNYIFIGRRNKARVMTEIGMYVHFKLLIIFDQKSMNDVLTFSQNNCTMNKCNDKRVRLNALMYKEST